MKVILEDVEKEIKVEVRVVYKIVVIGAITRERKVQTQIIEQADVNTINTFIYNTIDKGNIIFTDSFRGYNEVYKYGFINMRR